MRIVPECKRAGHCGSLNLQSNVPQGRSTLCTKVQSHILENGGRCWRRCAKCACHRCHAEAVGSGGGARSAHVTNVDGAPNAFLRLTMMRACGPTRGPLEASAARMYATLSGAAPNAQKEQTQRRGRDRPRRILPRGPLPPYREWLKGDGERFRYPAPGRGPHWIGATPFPLNPAFHPPPPVHQNVRDDMWKLHKQDPQQWTVRSLSSKFRLSLERTESVLRLKALEEEFVQEVRCLWLRQRCGIRLVLKTFHGYITLQPEPPAYTRTDLQAGETTTD